MKTSLLMILVLITAFLYTPQSFAFEDKMSLRICEYTAINDKKRLRKFLKASKVKMRSIFNSIECNGQNLLVFSASSNALDVGEYLIGKLPVKVVSKNIDEITKYSAHLAKVANERIN